MEESIYSNWRSMIHPHRVERSSKSTHDYGKYVIRPLERGFGTTLGNAMRRTLLSSLQGAAITHVMIKGADEGVEFLPGVVESVTDILLNMKGLRVKLLNGFSGEGKLNIKGKNGKIRVVTRSDMDMSDGCVVLNPDHPIVTVTGTGTFEADVRIQLGRGYISAATNQEDAPKGFTGVDAAYSPIERVRYNVTNARVGHRTDYDRLTLEVWTDGSIVPEDALGFASNLLREQVQLFIHFDEEDEPEPQVIVDESPEWPPVLYQRLDTIELTVRSQNCLQNAGIDHIWELVQRTEGEMLKTRNFGRKSLNELKDVLAELGLTFGMRLEGFKPPEE